MANEIRYQVGFDVKQGDLSKLKSSLQQLQKLKFSDIMKINNTDISSARDALRSIQQDADKVENALNKAFNTKLNTVNISTFNSQLSKSGLSLQSIYQSFSRAGATGEAAFRNLTTQLLSTNVQLRQSHALLDKMATTLANTVKWNIASGAVNSMSRSIEQAWGYTKSLDTSLNNIRIVTGKSAEEMGKFAIQANEAAQSLGKTTTDYTNAALIYAQQGLSDQEIEERARITLMTANVTGQSTSDVSEELTAVWNGYKVNAEEAELYIDRLAAVAATTASDLEELSTGMSKVASAAAAMGVGEDQLAAQLSTIISVTRQAPESVGTALRTVYARISDIKAGIDEDGVTLGNYSGKMAELGFNVLDAAGNLRDMGEVMEEIGGRWQDLTREQQISLAQTMAGQRQYSNLIALFDNFEKYNQALNTAQNAAGTLQEQQDIYMESTAAHLQTLKAAVENIYDSLADTDGINSIVDGLTVAANLVANFVDGIGGGASVLKSLGAIGLTVFSQQIASGLTTTINNLERARNQAEYFKNAIKEAEDIQSQGLGNDYTKFLIEEQSSLLNLGGKLSTNDFNAFQQKLKQLSQTSGDVEILDEKIQLLSNGFNSLGTTLDQVSVQYGTLDEMLSSANGVEEVKNALQTLQNSFNPVIEKQKQVRQAFKTFYADIQSGSPKAKDSFNTLKSSLQDLIGTLKTATVAEGGKTLFDSLPENAQKAVDKASKSLKTLDFSKIGNPQEASKKITAIFSNLNQTITHQINAISQMIEQADKGELQGLQEKLKNLQTLQKQIEDQYTVMQQRAERTVSVQNVVQLASGVARLGSAIQQIQNLGSIWKNEDLSTGQKLLQTITNLAISLPMLATGFTTTATSLGLMTVASTAEEAAQIGATIASSSHAISLGALSIAATNAGIQIQFLNTALTLNPAVLAAAAIIGLVVAYDKFTMSAKQAEQALSKFNDKQAELANNVSSTKNTIQDLESLRDEYNSLSNAAGQYDQNINNLSDKEKDRWNQIKDKIASVNPEIVAAYDSQGQAILRNNDALDQTIAKLQKKNELELKGFVNSDDFTNAVEGRRIQSVNARELVDVQQENINTNFNSSIADLNPDITDSIVQAALQRNNAAMTQYANEFRELSSKTIKDLSEDERQRYEEILNIFARSRDETLNTLANNYKENLLESIDTYISTWQIAQGRLTAAQQAADQASNADPAMLLQQLMYGNGDSSNYEKLKQAGLTDAEGLIAAWTQGHKQGMAEQYSTYLSQGKDFEAQLLKIYRISPKLFSQLKAENEKFKDTAFETGQQRANYLAEALNAIIENNNLQNASQDTLSQLFNYYFGLNLDGQNFNTDGLVRSISDPFIDSIDEVRKDIELKIGEPQEGLLNKLLGIDTQGVSWENIQNGLEEVVLTADNWHEVLQQIIADQQVIQQQQNNIASLSVISQNGEKLQSGKNLSKKENQAYQDNLNSVIESANQINDQDLLESAQLLQKTWLAGSEEYQQALDKVLQKIIELKAEQAKQENRAFTDEQIADIEKYATTIERVNNLYESGVIQDQVHYHALLDKAIREELKTLKVSGPAYQNYVKQLEKLRKQTQSTVDGVNELGEQVNLSDEALQQMALNDLKLVDSLQKLQKSYKNLKDDLKNPDPGSIDFMNAMSEMVDIINNIPGIHIDLTNENAINYLEDVKAIAEGAQGAVQRLRQKLAEQEIEKVKVEAELDDDSVSVDILNRLNSLIQQLSPEDIKTHAYLQDAEFVAQLNKLMRDANLTREQCNKILSSIGVKAKITTKQIPITAVGSGILANSPAKLPAGSAALSSKGRLDALGQAASALPQTGAIGYLQVPEVTYQPINSSGGGGDVIPSSGGKGGGGGGGGGGKAKQPKHEDPVKDEKDAYHDIDRQIKKLEQDYSNLEEEKDKLFGKDLSDNLNKEIEYLQRENQLYGEKLQIVEKERQRIGDLLAAEGVLFDPETNEISNYTEILDTKLAALNTLIEEYNNMSAEQQQKNKQTLDQAKKDYNEFKKLIDEYDKTLDLGREYNEKINDNLQKQFEKRIEDFRIKIEIHLDMGEAEREWNNFRRNVLNHSDILKESDFDKLLKDAAQNYQDVLSYFDINGQMGTLEALTNQLLATQDELDEINGGGESSIYGNNKKQAMQDLKTDLNELMQQMQDVEGLIDSIDEAYLNTIDDIMDQFDKQINDYKLIGELIEHDMDLLSLLYGDRNYDAMDRYYSTLRDNNLQQLDSLKQQRDFWKQEWDEAVARGDSEAAKKFEEHYKDTIGNLNSLIEESAQNLLNKYVNAIDGIFDALDKKISNGLGTDYLSAEWQLMRKNADEYLDTINSAFALQDLENKFNDALNDTKSLKAQQAIKTLMDAQLENLRTKEKLTQYDVERAEKLLQIEQARIALEDAQASKTSMRLKRDSQGNYSYEYVADQGDIAEAEQGLAAAQNDLYNFDKDRYQSNLDDMLSAWQEFQERYKEIVTDVSLSEEERVANLALLREQYGQYINDKTAENLVVRTNLMESAFADIAAIYDTDVENYNQMADNEKNILMGDLVPAWQSGIQQMADKVAGQGGFIPTCEQAFNNITEATEDYKDELDDMARVAGMSLDDVKQGVDVLADSFGNLVEKNDDLLNRMDQELTSIESLVKAARSLKEQYDDVYKAAKSAASAIHETLQDNRADAIENDLDDEDDDNNWIEDDVKHGPGAKVTFIEGGNGPSTVYNESLKYATDDQIKASTLEVRAYGNTDSSLLDLFTSQVDTGIRSTVSTLRNNISDKINEKLKRISSLDSGGYTGQWSGDGGKLALLHQKELVLNPGDTTNLLNSVEILRSMMNSLDGSLFARANNIKSGFFNTSNDEDGLEQNVHIDASFPNVNSKREIEEALSDLVNLAAQRAMRR